MGNGNHRNWGRLLNEKDSTPKFYIPTMEEASVLGYCKLMAPEGNIKRQVVLFNNIEIGFIQLGHGFGESYVVKHNHEKTGEKLRMSKDEALLRLVAIND